MEDKMGIFSILWLVGSFGNNVFVVKLLKTAIFFLLYKKHGWVDLHKSIAVKLTLKEHAFNNVEVLEGLL